MGNNKSYKILNEVLKTLNNKSNDDYVISTYYPKLNRDDKQFLNEHKDEFYQFMIDGYAAAGLGKWLGCANSNALGKNTSCLRVGYLNGVLIALSVYTDYQDGHKCVGCTVTTNSELRQIGKKCLNDMIKIDIGAEKEFYWTVCSDKVEILWEKFGGTKIPNIFVKDYKLHDVVKLHNDGYKFSIAFRDPVTREITAIDDKVIFGYNKRETYEKVTRYMQDYINGNCHDDPINESCNYLDIADKLHSNFATFIECVYVYGWYDLPKESIDYLKELIIDAEKLISTYSGKENGKNSRINALKTNLDTCKIMLKEDIRPLEIHVSR